MNKVLVKYSEIGLKGKNKHEFVGRLIGNTQKSANRFNLNIVSIYKESARIIFVYEENTKKEDIINSLSKVFGIKNFTFIKEIEKSIESIQKEAKIILEGYKEKGVKRIGFKTKRADKAFPLISPEINAKMGEIASDLGLEINYRNPQEMVYVEITYKNCYIYSEKFAGQGGLPIENSKKILCLLSGGIDSPVAATQIMKRGCRVDYLHLHVFMKNEFVLKSKIKDIVDKLNNYGYKARLYLMPYSFYELKTSGVVDQRYELIFFKHYIFKLAEALAEKYGYDAIASGDNLNQVASQTLGNLKCVSFGVNLPIFRPLLTYDKDDIIEKAREIDTFEISNEDYKDCCSISAKNPFTQCPLEKFKSEVLDKVDIDKLVGESLEEIESYMIK